MDDQSCQNQLKFPTCMKLVVPTPLENDESTFMSVNVADN
jgi:hypothetical protein